MTRHSHRLIGIATAYILGYPLFPALIASTLPDIDTKWAKGKASLLTAHRGITHHIGIVILLISVAIVLNNIVFTSFVIGYVSHIFADILTISGVPYYRHKDRISLKLFATGSVGEYVFVVSLISIIAIIFAFTNSFYIPFDFQLFFEIIRNINSYISVSI